MRKNGCKKLVTAFNAEEKVIPLKFTSLKFFGIMELKLHKLLKMCVYITSTELNNLTPLFLIMKTHILNVF